MSQPRPTHSRSNKCPVRVPTSQCEALITLFTRTHYSRKRKTPLPYALDLNPPASAPDRNPNSTIISTNPENLIRKSQPAAPRCVCCVVDECPFPFVIVTESHSACRRKYASSCLLGVNKFRVHSLEQRERERESAEWGINLKENSSLSSDGTSTIHHHTEISY